MVARWLNEPKFLKNSNYVSGWKWPLIPLWGSSNEYIDNEKGNRCPDLLGIDVPIFAKDIP